MSRGRRRHTLNWLGLLSIVAGIAAIVATQIPIAGYGPVPIAILAAGIGVLGFFISLIAGRWGSGTPVIGVLIAAGVFGWIRYSDGTLGAWWATVHPAAGASPSAAPKVADKPSSAPPADSSAPPNSDSTGNIFTDPSYAPPATAPSSTP